MRFSSIFQIASVPTQPALPAEGIAAPAAQVEQDATPLVAPELPDDLDARVRLVGEWQLGED